MVYDFAMTERELEFVCCCGTPACRGLITGYRGLPDSLRRSYGSFVSDYLREEDRPSPAERSGSVLAGSAASIS